MTLLRHAFLQCRWPLCAFANSFPNSILLNLRECHRTHGLVSAPNHSMLLILTYVEKGNNSVIFIFFSFLVELSKLFPKANNIKNVAKSLYLWYLSIGGSSILFSHFLQGAWTSRLTPQSFVRVCVSLSTSLSTSLSLLILSITWLKRKNRYNLLEREQGNSTSDFRRHSAASVRNTPPYKTQQPLPTELPWHPVTEEGLTQCNDSQIQQEISFGILNVKITCIIIEYLKVTKIV